MKQYACYLTVRYYIGPFEGKDEEEARVAADNYLAWIKADEIVHEGEIVVEVCE